MRGGRVSKCSIVSANLRLELGTYKYGIEFLRSLCCVSALALVTFKTGFTGGTTWSLRL